MLLATWLAAPVVALAVAGSSTAVPPAPPLTMGAPAAEPLPGCAAAGPCVIVQVVAGKNVVSTDYFYADQITDNGDITSTSYPVNGGTDAVVQKGSSLSRLVALAVDPSTVTFAEVVAPPPDKYSRHLLAGQEIGPGGSAGFEDGLVPAFYSTDPNPSNPTRFNYIRPQRDPDDANGAVGPDQGTFFSDPGGSLLIRAHTTGEILDVDVTAAATDGSNRAYTLATDPTGAGFLFDWRLPGGAGSTQATPTYTFPSGSLAGTYSAVVSLEGADGSYGYGRADLQAGPAPSASPSPSQSSPGTGGSGPGSEGPTESPSDTATGDPNPQPTGGDGTGTATATPTATSTGSGVPASEAGSSGPTTPADPPSAPSPPVATGATGQEVTGILLAAGQIVDQNGEVVSDAPQPSQAAAPISDPPFRVLTGVWLGVATLLLLLAGGISESPWLRIWLDERRTRRRS